MHTLELAAFNDRFRQKFEMNDDDGDDGDGDDNDDGDDDNNDDGDVDDDDDEG